MTVGMSTYGNWGSGGISCNYGTRCKGERPSLRPMKQAPAPVVYILFEPHI
jgi:hypothetical protein